MIAMTAGWVIQKGGTMNPVVLFVGSLIAVALMFLFDNTGIIAGVYAFGSAAFILDFMALATVIK